jgi:hypothetical protein
MMILRLPRNKTRHQPRLESYFQLFPLLLLVRLIYHYIFKLWKQVPLVARPPFLYTLRDAPLSKTDLGMYYAFPPVYVNNTLPFECTQVDVHNV